MNIFLVYIENNYGQLILLSVPYIASRLHNNKLFFENNRFIVIYCKYFSISF